MKRLFKNVLAVTLIFSLIITSCSPSDSKLSENIKTNLELLDSAIQVSVESGVVTLSGQVADESMKNAAESSIQEVKGVKSVVNNLTVKPELTDMDLSGRPDACRIHSVCNRGGA